MQEKRADTKFYEELLASLRFPEIHCREEEIRNAYTETFYWIFDHTDNYMPQNLNLVEWLETGSEIFWVRGKAGSGKSTLMKYLWQHSRTRDHLGTWAEPAELIMPAYFFWTAGSSLQKTLIGLLRSLIYQILQKRPELIAYMKKVTHPMGLPFLFGKTRDEIPNWTESRLQQCFVLLTKEIPSDCRICLFIDGLDEFSGNHWAFVDFLVKLVENQAIKCCVSSRPERPFDDLGSCAIVLRLEHYTRADIENYVRGNFAETPRHRSPHITERELERIVQKISELADGVFLWVELVVKSQITMIRNEDDFNMLWSHLEHLPREVEGLYERMLERIDSAYRGEAAKYIRYTCMWDDLKDQSITVLQLAIALFGLTEEMELKSFPLDHQMINSKCERVIRRIMSTCSGILEIHEGGSSEYLSDRTNFEEEEPTRSYIGLRIQFHHRRASDFFMRGNPGFQFLELNSQNTANPRILLTAVNLGEMVFHGPWISEDLAWRLIQDLLLDFERTVSLRNKSSFSYLNYLDNTLGRCTGLFWGATENTSHWVRYFTRSSIGYRALIHPVYDQWFEVAGDVRRPDNFLSFAASRHFHKCVSIAISNHQIHAQPERLTNLLLYSRAQGYSIHDSKQQKMMLHILKCGANLQSDRGHLLWEIMLGSLVDPLLVGRPSHDLFEKTTRMIQAFLEAGACRHPIIGLSRCGRFATNESVMCGFVIDTSIIPILDWIRNKGELPASRDYRNSEPVLINQKALRIWFEADRSPGGLFEWYRAERYALSQEQARGLHQCVMAIIEAEDDETRAEADVRFHTQLGEIWAIACP